MDINGLGAAKCHAGTTALAEAFVNPGQCFNHFAIAVFNFFALNSLVRANALAQETAHALRINRGWLAIYHSHQRIAG